MSNDEGVLLGVEDRVFTCVTHKSINFSKKQIRETEMVVKGILPGFKKNGFF